MKTHLFKFPFPTLRIITQSIGVGHLEEARKREKMQDSREIKVEIFKKSEAVMKKVIEQKMGLHYTDTAFLLPLCLNKPKASVMEGDGGLESDWG